MGKLIIVAGILASLAIAWYVVIPTYFIGRRSPKFYGYMTSSPDNKGNFKKMMKMPCRSYFQPYE